MTDPTGWAAPTNPAAPGQPQQPYSPYGQTPQQNPYAPYPGGPGGPGGPGMWGQQPPPNTKVNRFAVAALICGILPTAVIAIGLGIRALVQIGQRGGRGKPMAIIGIVLGGVWTLIFVLAGIGAAVDRNQPPNSTRQDVRTLKVGDCTGLIKDGARIIDVAAIPCEKAHRDEVYAQVTIPGEAYPGDAGVQQQAQDLCDGEASKLADADKATLPAQTVEFSLFPTERVWNTGNHTATCLIQLPSDRSGRQLPIQ